MATIVRNMMPTGSAILSRSLGKVTNQHACVASAVVRLHHQFHPTTSLTVVLRKSSTSRKRFRVLEHPASESVSISQKAASNEDIHLSSAWREKGHTTYTVEDHTQTSWRVDDARKSNDRSRAKVKGFPLDYNYMNRSFEMYILKHFLPSDYPHSVGSGYAQFSGAAFLASIAGSASMVLSTQTLLLAVGVVGAASSSSVVASTSVGATASASIMAGALNWVLKDGIGQLGGVLFASRFGQSRHFDTNPKYWRMIAALSLDAAALMELMSPFVSPAWVLPVACVANVSKNVGFITASASRAALHQSLALAGNLADVTAKSGSQSMAAGLCGTALGIGLSTALGQQSVEAFIMCFVGLAMVHQGCNYMSVRAVSLNHLNLDRLRLLVQAHFQDGRILSPDDVAKMENFLPVPFIFSSKKNSNLPYSWLVLGESLKGVCPGGPCELNELLNASVDEKYVLNVQEAPNDPSQVRICLLFFTEATGDDLIKGILHAALLYFKCEQQQMLDFDDSSLQHRQSKLELVSDTHRELCRSFPTFLSNLHLEGWKSELTCVEPSTANRISIQM